MKSLQTEEQKVNEHDQTFFNAAENQVNSYGSSVEKLAYIQGYQDGIRFAQSVHTDIVSSFPKKHES